VARISGVDLPSKKRLVIALTYIYGIGNTRAKKICAQVGLSEDIKVFELTEEHIARLREAVEKNYVTETELREQVKKSILSLGDTYRGKRHRAKLPVRGQRSRSNARTRKGNQRKPVEKKKATNR
jgi:small subunit ribosomal protein S13